MAFEGMMDVLLGWLLNFEPIWALLIVSVIFSVISNIAYKFFTDQHLMKELKADLKRFQNEMKEFKDHPQKMMEIQKKAMSKNFEYMKHSMKPTLITFIPIILIFGWLTTHLAYAPLMPGEDFNTTITFKDGVTGSAIIEVPPGIEVVGSDSIEIEEKECKGAFFSKRACGVATFNLKGLNNGEYPLVFKYEDEEQDKNVLITKDQEYLPVEKLITDSDNFEKIQVGNAKLKPLNLFGWKIGWLGTYIIFSLIISMSLRKIMKLH